MARGVGRVDPFDEQILEIAAGIAHPPGDMAIVAEDDERKPGSRRAGYFQLGRGDPNQVPQDRSREPQVGIVGENRLAGRGCRAPDHPYVGGAPRHLQRRRFRYGQSFQGQAEARSVGSFDGDRLVAGVGRPQLGDLLVGQSASQPRAQQFGAAIAGKPQGHDPDPHQGIGGTPRFGLQTQGDELRRQGAVAVFDPGVDAGRVCVERPARILR